MPDLTKTWIGCADENFTVGRGGYKPEGIAMHIMAGTLVGTDAWFLTPPAKRPDGKASSSHYGIGKQGQIHVYVLEENSAYHAGRVKPKPSTLPLLVQFPGNPNAFLIGIEHEGQVDDDWTPEMIEASAQLVAEICLRWEIPIDRTHIVKHHEIFQPKPCPGPKCPMDEIVAKALQIASPSAS